MESHSGFGWHESYQCPECHVIDDACFQEEGDLEITILTCCGIIIVDVVEEVVA
tara:strand:- start:6114 stop:6275 length:162 start_codon:yes stop_codon:yes gene_type:complete